MRDKIVGLRAEGKTYQEIADELGFSFTTVRREIEAYTADARERAADIAAERMALADARIEWLIERVSKAIATDEGFDAKKYKIAIELLTRQARLLGYDREPQAATTGDNWLNTAPPPELKRYAKELGLEIPETFGG